VPLAVQHVVPLQGALVLEHAATLYDHNMSLVLEVEQCTRYHIQRWYSVLANYGGDRFFLKHPDVGPAIVRPTDCLQP